MLEVEKKNPAVTNYKLKLRNYESGNEELQILQNFLKHNKKF